MLNQIQGLLNDLSTAEQRVANWVINHPRQSTESTLAEVARHSGVSEPTVVRFCRSVGVSGFRELTLRLAEALSRPATYLHQDVAVDDSNADAVNKVFDASIRVLVDTRAQLAGQPFDEAVERMAQARQLIFIGMGASGYVARDAAHKFFRLGIPCSALTDIPSILQFASIAQPNDVLLFVSTLGGWQELTRAAGLARDRDATVIALTRPGCELSEQATLLFACEPAEDTCVFTPMTSRLAQLALLDALLVTLALFMGAAATDKLRATKSAIN